MHYLQNGTQTEVPPEPKPTVGNEGYFTETGQPSIPGADWFNASIKEFQNALTEAGIEFDPERFDHLNRLIASSGSHSLLYRVGQKAEIHSSVIPDWLLKADGSTVSRTVDDVLWAHASASGLVIAQATKDEDPETYAMYYGDGDGSTTFSLPNWYLGHFSRGNPAGVALGETQLDQNKAHRHSWGFGGAQENPTGSGETASTGPNGSVTVMTTLEGGNEARPKTGNINICIERGKIPA